MTHIHSRHPPFSRSLCNLGLRFCAFRLPRLRLTFLAVSVRFAIFDGCVALFGSRACLKFFRLDGQTLKTSLSSPWLLLPLLCFSRASFLGHRSFRTRISASTSVGGQWQQERQSLPWCPPPLGLLTATGLFLCARVWALPPHDGASSPEHVIALQPPSVADSLPTERAANHCAECLPG